MTVDDTPCMQKNFASMNRLTVQRASRVFARVDSAHPEPAGWAGFYMP